MTDQLPLFALHPDRTPTWDDVHEGTARLVDRIEPCDHCESAPVSYWIDGECWNTPERFAYPMNNGDGTCTHHYIEWIGD